MTERAARTPRLAALIGLAAQLAGCGTVIMGTSTGRPGPSALQNGCNITRYSPCSHLSHVYAGASYDACTVGWALGALPKALRDDTLAAIAYSPAFLGLVGFLAVDLPVSATADTLLLPSTTQQQALRGDACPKGWKTIPPAGRPGAEQTPAR